MKRFRLPLLLLCGSLLTPHGQAAPLAPSPLPDAGGAEQSATSSTSTSQATATARVSSAAVRSLGAWQAGRPLVPAEAQRLADALLSEGAEPLGAELPAGTTTLVLQLDRARPLRRCQLINLNTRDGRVALAASAVQLPPESARWRPAAGGPQSLGNARGGATVQEWELLADARYVRVEITLPQPGRIASLGLFERAANSSMTASALPPDRALPTASNNRMVAAFSFASLSSAAGSRAHGGGQVVTVSAGEDLRGAAAMIDGDLTTGYTFRKTGGRGALAVFDLGRRAAPGRLTVSYRSGTAGQVEAYLLNELPARGEENAVRQLLASRTPDAHTTLTATRGSGLQRAGLTLGDHQGRFLALVFVSANGSEASRSGKEDFKDRVDGKDYGSSSPRPTGADRASRPSSNGGETGGAADSGFRGTTPGGSSGTVLGDDLSGTAPGGSSGTVLGNGLSNGGGTASGDGVGGTTPMAADQGGGLQVVEITASGTDGFGTLLTSTGGSFNGLSGLPGGGPGTTFAPGSFFSPAGNFTSVSPGVDSSGPLLPVTFPVSEITP